MKRHFATIVALLVLAAARSPYAGRHEIVPVSEAGSLCEAIDASEAAFAGTVAKIEPSPFSSTSHVLVMVVDHVLWGAAARGDTLRILWRYEYRTSESGEVDFSHKPVHGGIVPNEDVPSMRAVWFLGRRSLGSAFLDGATVGQPLLVRDGTASFLEDELKRCPRIEEGHPEQSRRATLASYIGR